MSFFEMEMKKLDLIHGKCKPGSPWQNGIVERSHRTDNEELFRRMRFSSSEERKYQLKLWEMEYNNRRPHQGLRGAIPVEIYVRDYGVHARTRMIM
jgi:hypothetical protein